MQSTVEVSKNVTRLSESTNLEDGISTFSGTLQSSQDFSISPEDRFEHETVTVPTRSIRNITNPSDQLKWEIPGISIEEITYQGDFQSQ
jgi:hypothetical protein